MHANKEYGQMNQDEVRGWAVRCMARIYAGIWFGRMASIAMFCIGIAVFMVSLVAAAVILAPSKVAKEYRQMNEDARAWAATLLFLLVAIGGFGFVIWFGMHKHDVGVREENAIPGDVWLGSHPDIWYGASLEVEGRIVSNDAQDTCVSERHLRNVTIERCFRQVILEVTSTNSKALTSTDRCYHRRFCGSYVPIEWLPPILKSAGRIPLQAENTSVIETNAPVKGLLVAHTRRPPGSGFGDRSPRTITWERLLITGVANK